MGAKFYEHVSVVTATTGTGPITLGAAVGSLWQTFTQAGVQSGELVEAFIQDLGTGNRERCQLTATSSAGVWTCARTTFMWSDTGSELALSGNATVTIVPSAADLNNLISASQSSVVRQQFSGDGATTSFTVTNGYTANTLLVFVNGVKQTPTDVTQSTGTTIVFAVAPLNGATIDIYGYVGVLTQAYLPLDGSAAMTANLTVTATGADSWIISKAPAGWAGHVSVIGNNGTAGTTDFVMTQDSAGGAYVWNRANQYLLFATNSVERARFTATGNFGIGTTTVPSKLTVGGTQGHYRVDPDGLASTLAVYATNSTDTGYLNLRQDAASHIFAISGSQKMLIDSSGNVGIGTNGTAGYTLSTNGGRVQFQGSNDNYQLYVSRTAATNGVFFGSPAADNFSISNASGTEMIRGAYGGIAINCTPGGWAANCRLEVRQLGSGDNCISGYATFGSGTAALWRVDNTGSSLESYYYSTTQVGTVTTNGGATFYNTTSDERLKVFDGEYSAITANSIIKADPVRNFTWNSFSASPGSTAIGWGAQTSYGISPDLASPGTDELDEDGKPKQLWGVDQAKRTPYLWAAVGAEGGILDRLDALEATVAAQAEQINQLLAALAAKQ